MKSGLRYAKDIDTPARLSKKVSSVLVADVGSAKCELRSPWQGLGQQSAIADTRPVPQNLNGRDFRECDRALVVFCALINPRFYDIYLCLSGRRAFTMRHAYRGVDSAFDKHHQRAGKTVFRFDYSTILGSFHQ